MEGCGDVRQHQRGRGAAVADAVPQGDGQSGVAQVRQRVLAHVLVSFEAGWYRGLEVRGRAHHLMPNFELPGAALVEELGSK
jgi:hypothetical protein